MFQLLQLCFSCFSRISAASAVFQLLQLCFSCFSCVSAASAVFQLLQLCFSCCISLFLRLFVTLGIDDGQTDRQTLRLIKPAIRRQNIDIWNWHLFEQRTSTLWYVSPLSQETLVEYLTKKVSYWCASAVFQLLQLCFSCFSCVSAVFQLLQLCFSCCI